MKKLSLSLVTLLSACAAQAPLTRMPSHSQRVPSSSSDADEPSDTNGNEAWSPDYGNTELREYGWNHLSAITLGFYEAPSTENFSAAEGNISGSFSGLRSNPDFPYFSFSSANEAEKFLEKNGATPKPYVSQLYDFKDDGPCLTVNVIDHYWKEPSRWFGLRAGQHIYGEHLKNFLVSAGTLKGELEEVKAPLVNEKLCTGDHFSVNGHTLRITKVSAAAGLNVSSAPGATYPTYPSLILTDEAGQAYLTESNAIRRLKNLSDTHATAARASSDTHKCGASTHATSEDFAATSAQANERAKAIMAAQCATIGHHLGESVKYEPSKYDVCFETGWNQAHTIAHGHCD